MRSAGEVEQKIKRTGTRYPLASTLWGRPPQSAGRLLESQPHKMPKWNKNVFVFASVFVCAHFCLLVFMFTFSSLTKFSGFQLQLPRFLLLHIVDSRITLLSWPWNRCTVPTCSTCKHLTWANEPLLYWVGYMWHIYFCPPSACSCCQFLSFYQPF